MYVRLLGVVLLIAFLSFWVQIEGLIGDRGLAPASELIDRLERSGRGFFDHPTLAWLGASTRALELVCAGGVFASVLVILGVVPRAALIACWALYLSIVNAGYPFTAFQWDALLLEVTFASTLVAPLVWWDRPARAREPDAIARWVLWLLLFRFMFRSGLVKLTSGDPTWADLTALDYHYETQPLPTVLGWWAHQLPAWMNAVSTVAMFVIELVVPFSIFVPKRWARRAAAAAFTSLMLLIALTGNYGFFNLLTVALCVTLLDDALVERALPGRRVAAAEPEDRSPRWWVRLPAAVVLAIGVLTFLTGFGGGGGPVTTAVAPFHTFNNYGLFAVMTTERPEIQIEGSRDGITWEPYVFEHKPGPIDRAPTLSQPHMPRLDWQMWFAALGRWQHNPWLVRLMERLVEGEPSVVALFEHDPFEGDPPRYVRAVLYDYRFTDPDELDRSGAWWRRAELGPYAPVVRRP